MCLSHLRQELGGCLMDKLFLLYNCSNEELIKASRSKEKVLAKLGEDLLAGGMVVFYKLIEVDLDEIED